MHDGIIIAFCGFDEIRGLDVTTGTFLWSYPLAREPIQFFRVSAGGIAIEYETRLDLVDPKTGALRFTRADLSPNLTDPIDLDDTTLYLGLGDRTVHAIDLATGTDRWSLQTTVNWIHAAPEGVFILTHIGHELINADPASGEKRWTSAATGDRLTYGGVIGVAGGHVIAQGNKSGNIVTFKLEDGSLGWSFNEVEKVNLVAVVGDDRVAFTRDENLLQVLDATNGEIVDEQSASVWFRPSIDDGRIAYVTTQGIVTVQTLP